ncbi:MAG: PSD1 and planctomycete cytochrome C domain-containing protein [Prosthecobacter sp.]|uniref:PSD1 and planctomycete cytochrome C domain-containing protein n=1 Tax=Prosthecobacter sp. TaxID=1965333 RepID=UPI0038FFD60B
MKFIYIVCFLMSLRAASAADSLRYNRDIRPILSDNCFACHGPDKGNRKAELRLDLREVAIQPAKSGDTAIVPGKVEESALVARILSDDEDEIMPPTKSHKKISEAQKVILKRWVAEGAVYEKHWAFEPPQRATLPAVKTAGWVRNPIDAFVLAGLEEVGLQPAAEADRRTLARRLSLDMTGLPPKPEEVEGFVNDKSPDAFEKLVKRLMDSQQWGEHRGRYWLDAARYGDTHGIHHDAYREMWPYRDWVISAFNKNMRFDAFTVEQIAGDLLPNPTREQLIATGFHRCNITTAEGGTIADENLAMYANDRVTTTSWVWLGLTANCAACHDHKFDPITQKDFYSMAAYFRNTTQGAMDGNVKDTKPIIYLPESKDEKRFAELPKLIAAANAAVTQRRRDAAKDAEAWAGIVTPEKFGISAEALVDNVDAAKPFSVAARVKTSKDGVIAGQLFVQGKKFGLQAGKLIAISKRDVITPGKEQHLMASFDGKNGIVLYLDGKEVESDRKGKMTAKEQLEGATDLKMYARTLSKTDALSLNDEARLRKTVAIALDKRNPKQKTELTDFYFRSVDEPSMELAMQIDSLTAEDAAIRARSTLTHVQEEKQGEAMANILMRGAYDKVGEKVTPAGFSALHEMPKDAPKNRLGLAQWLVSPQNPLSARVTVNRFWQELFGTGLVRTAEDFGSQGELPSNPELLDWLAVEFRESGWDVKKLFTLMVTSSTYRQASKITPEKLARDPQNRMLSRGPRFRMDAEMIRDYALAVGGTLLPKMGGPGTKPYQPSNIWEVVGLHGSRYTQDKGENLYRRTIYNFWKRQAPSPNMEVFNAPTREVCTVRRERTNTPLQALVTLNDPQFVEAARRLAEAVMKQKKDAPAIITELASRVLLRPLNDAETKVVNATLAELETEFTAHPERATAFLNIGETKADASLPAPKLAAYGMIASQLLNLDEALNK